MTVRTLASHEIAAVIPAFNEAMSIAKVVTAVAQYARPIVVCDGSDDGTAQLARESGAEVVVHARNLGYDMALESGLFKAVELGYEYAVTLDGDGQHALTALEQFKIELANGADLVVGVRDRHQRVSESLFAMLGQLLWQIQDPLCGMKGYRLALLKRVGHFDSYSSIGTEYTLRAARTGCKISQVQVRTCDRVGVSRFGGGLRANWRILRALALGLVYARRFSN